MKAQSQGIIRLSRLTLKALNIFYINHRVQTYFLFSWKSSDMSQSALSDSFEYLCYGSTASINIFTQVWGLTSDIRI